MPVPKECSKCGKPFECCADKRGCWCEGYSLQPEALQELKENFENCLCKECLAEYGDKKEQD
jgi:hypothetical protein